jgi:hypothetical protein
VKVRNETKQGKFPSEAKGTNDALTKFIGEVREDIEIKHIIKLLDGYYASIILVS